MPDNLIRQSDCKATSTEEKHEVPLVSPGPTLPRYDNHHPVKPPPGFLPLGDQCIPSNARSIYNDYSFTPVFNDTEPTTNPFLADQQFVSGDAIKQMYMSVWNENKKLQLRVSEILHDLLEHSSLSFKDHVQLNKMLKIIERALLEQKDNRSTVVKTPSASNLMNGTTSNIDVGLAQKASYNLNSETFASQDLIANTFSMSNPFNVNSDRPQNNTTFSTYGPDGFAFKTNWSQSSEVSPRVQMSPSTTPSPTPSMFVNHIPPVNTLPPKVSQENIPLSTPVPPVAPTSAGTPTNFSEFLDNVKVQFTNMLKDTNPFKASMTEMQVPETQNERMAHNYDAGLASYFSATNSQSYAPKTEIANIHARSNCFTPAGHAGENYTTKIVYESGPVMYNTQKKQADIDARLNACSNNYNNVQNAQSLELGQCGTKLTSQPANNIAASHTQHKAINHQMMREQVNETYITQPSTYYVQNSQPVTNNEPIYYQQNGNANNSRSLSSQSWSPENMVNSKFQNSVPLSNHNENALFAPPVTLSRQDWNCDNSRRSVLQKNEATDSSYSFTFKDGYNKERPTVTYANSWYNIENESIQHRNAACNNTFLFQKIGTILLNI